MVMLRFNDPIGLPKEYNLLLTLDDVEQILFEKAKTLLNNTFDDYCVDHTHPHDKIQKEFKDGEESPLIAEHGRCILKLAKESSPEIREYIETNYPKSIFGIYQEAVKLFKGLRKHSISQVKVDYTDKSESKKLEDVDLDCYTEKKSYRVYSLDGAWEFVFKNKKDAESVVAKLRGSSGYMFVNYHDCFAKIKMPFDLGILRSANAIIKNKEITFLCDDDYLALIFQHLWNQHKSLP